MTSPAPEAVPPTVLPAAPESISTPARPFLSATVPVFSFTSPKSSALIVILEAPLTSTPSYETSVIVSPSIVLPDAPELTVNPSVVAFVPVPLTWMSGWPSAFGSVVPLITTGCASAGKAESTSIVYTPFFWSLLGRLKLIRLGFAAVAGVALDSVIAERSVPAAVVSALLVTVKVESICRPSSSSTANRRQRAACRRAAPWWSVVGRRVR